MSRRFFTLSIMLALGGAAARGVPPTETQAPSPESVLGFRPGDDGKLADWPEVVGYFRALDRASDRVLVEDVGPTTEGRPFLIATITSPANMRRLEEIRRDNLRLADPRGLEDEDARRIVARGKTVVAMNFSIHSTEVGGTLTAMLFAHHLAATTDPATLEALNRTVLLMIPSHNPDGTDIVSAWHRKQKGTAFEGTEPPVLYHHYAGHDNNRDWYMFTQAETRLTVAHLYDRWHPQIVHDVHQMRTNGARLFLPPYLDPWEPNVDPALRAAAGALGADVAARLTGAGRTGVVVGALFDAWTPARAYPHTHGGVRILSETASAKLAGPLEMPATSLRPGPGYDPRSPSWNQPLPWPGGTWRLRDIVDTQLRTSTAILDHASSNREFWLETALRVNRRAVARREPFAFVIPGGQEDPLAVAELVRVMRTGGVEVHRCRSTLTVAGRTYPTGSYVILMQQPGSAFAQTLLERQHYPDLRESPDGPPRRPYDVTAHTLPLLLGVEAVAVPAPFAADLEPVAGAAVVPGKVEGAGPAFAIGHANGDLVALGRLLGEGVEVSWALAPFEDGGRRFSAGALLVPAKARPLLLRAAADLGVVARSVAKAPRALRLTRPRVGLYQSWVPSMDEGWTRFVFEKQAGVEYQTLHDRDLRGGGGLRERFDAIVLPSQSPAQILNGHPVGGMPDEYTGGLGTQGVAALRAFVEAGGTLVALDAASSFAIEHLALPVTQSLGASGSSADFFCPGALLEVAVDPARPLGHGLRTRTPIWFESSPVFEAPDSTVVARYGGTPLLSGWLLGGARLDRKAALVDVPLGRGHVVLFGFRPQYRAQSWATYIPFLNALYLSATVEGH
jgi:Zinc carboxypeptidase